MASTVKVTYAGLDQDVDRTVAPICPVFFPTNSYVDTKPYEDTVYDTNVRGFGEIKLRHPFDAISIPSSHPIWQLHLAGVDAENPLEFDVQSPYEDFYWKQMAEELAPEGVVIEVTEG